MDRSGRQRAVARHPEEVAELGSQLATAGDRDGLAALFEAGALLEPAAGRSARGSADLRAACALLCERVSGLDVELVAIHVCSDLALVTVGWVAQLPGSRASGFGTAVLRQQPDGRWLIVIGDIRLAPAQDAQPAR